jgi:4-hydroxy 2-oxovalerate aldolase
MNSPLLLDCTLRDGGFVNDWNFGFGSIKSIISRLDDAGVDVIEVGFIDERRSYDEDRSIFPDTDSILPLFKNLDRPKAIVAGMVDFGTCSLDKISLQSESCLDGIRVIFKKHDQDKALDLLSQIKEKGYKIFVNPVSITSYTDDEALSLIAKINKIKPYATSVVDTYGLMHSKELLHYFEIINKELEEDIILGYHAHNNFQMAYANSIALMNRELDRSIMIDGTLYGMGKSAGNACTELLAMYMNEYCGRNFKIHQLQEAIDVDILQEYQKKFWGYNFEYYIAALNDCHPSYVRFLLDKKTISVKAVNEIVNVIPGDKKLTYDKTLIERLYAEYQNKYCDDTLVVDALKKEFFDKNILLLGPGKSLQENTDSIDRFIGEKNPAVVSINFLHERYPIDYVFMGNAKRYSQFFHKIYGENSRAKIICTSNITDAGKRIDYTVNYSGLLAETEAIRDNPLILFLNLLKKIGAVKGVWLAGFDGYVQDNADNYYGDYVRLLYCQDDVVLRNEAIKNELQKMASSIEVKFLTPTRYV